MKFKMASKANDNGARKQLIIDIDKKTFTRGYFLFTGADVSDLTQKQFAQVIEMLKSNDFLEV